jgi:hypothetical protein
MISAAGIKILLHLQTILMKETGTLNEIICKIHKTGR